MIVGKAGRASHLIVGILQARIGVQPGHALRDGTVRKPLRTQDGIQLLLDAGYLRQADVVNLLGVQRSRSVTADQVIVVPVPSGSFQTP